MSKFIIQGGKPLQGTIQPQGSKNEAFQVMCAALLTTHPVTIHNVPDILDIRGLLEVFKILGVQIQQLDTHTYRLQAANISMEDIDGEKLRLYGSKLRGSVLILGPLLARLGKVIIPLPGGDKIGRRRLDTHFLGVSKLGALFHYDTHQEAYVVWAKKLIGNYILLDESSVTGTANIIMAAVLASGKTTIYNAACEPHVQQLCNMLVRMGAKIEGIGSNLLNIEGVESLQGTEHTIWPDMLEIGSLIGLAAMTNSSLTIQNAISPQQLDPVLDRFGALGIQLTVTDMDIIVPAQDSYAIRVALRPHHILTLADAVWPGLPSDLLSILLVTAIQAKGSVLIHQKMYESRLFFVDSLIEMGAQLVLCDPHRVHIIGLNRSSPLRGIRMSSPDIRAGISLLIAALSAEGESVIENIQQIDRGYENLEERLRGLGADIERVED
jgi:UDP-N-acetylglucosamine 1-carboxyvinyltransferase